VFSKLNKALSLVYTKYDEASGKAAIKSTTNQSQVFFAIIMPMDLKALMRVCGQGNF
jgi:hypothetical protein